MPLTQLEPNLVEKVEKVRIQIDAFNGHKLARLSDLESKFPGLEFQKHHLLRITEDSPTYIDLNVSMPLDADEELLYSYVAFAKKVVRRPNPVKLAEN